MAAPTRVPSRAAGPVTFPLPGAARRSPAGRLCLAPSSRICRGRGNVTRPAAAISAAVPGRKQCRRPVFCRAVESIPGTTEIGSAAWDEFAGATSGKWEGVMVTYDAEGKATDVPLRYITGVGKIPADNMPFRDRVYDWRMEAECVVDSDGLSFTTNYLLPEIVIDADSIGSCGGSDCPLWVEERHSLLRGGGECKSILPSGAYSGGPRSLAPEGGDEAVLRFEHCLIDGRDHRVRIVQNVVSGAGGEWVLESMDLYNETKGRRPEKRLHTGDAVAVEGGVAEGYKCVAGSNYVPGADGKLEMRPAAGGNAATQEGRRWKLPLGVWSRVEGRGDELHVCAGWEVPDLAGLRHVATRTYKEGALQEISLRTCSRL